MRTITINNVKYNVNCNVLTYLYYRRIFKNDIFVDINIVRDFLLTQTRKDNEQEVISKLNGYIEALTRLTYVAIYTNNKTIEEYEKWTHTFKILEQDTNNIKTIIEAIIDCFIDGQVVEELEKENSSGDNKEVLFPEHLFISTCLQMGLTMQDLAQLTYIDVFKIILSCNTKKTNNGKQPRKATQADIDRLLM